MARAPFIWLDTVIGDIVDAVLLEMEAPLEWRERLVVHGHAFAARLLAPKRRRQRALPYRK